VTLVVVLLVLVSGRVVLPHVRRRRRTEPIDVDATARLLLIGLTAGLSMVAAMETAVDQIDDDAAAELRQMVRSAKMHGMASALTSAAGPSKRLFHRLARAQVTGSAATGTIATFIAEQRAVDRAGTLQRLRRLPVTLTVPLTLLILPGFILLTLGPTVAGIVKQLLGGLL
jgi:type II secretory pathway component PulF